LDVLREQTAPITPEQLFREAGFQTTEVDLFYRELLTLRERLHQQKPTGTKALEWPNAADVLLQLTSPDEP
jgi:hypothetical protein